MPFVLRYGLSKIFALLLCGVAFASVCAAAEKWEVTLDLPPLAVNQFYEGLLTVADSNGVGITGLRLQIRGRMPEHAHGLPTAPQITEKGQGRYSLKGLSFNMPGRWVIEILHDGETVLRQEYTVRF
ncbi:MAG: FixH family protein [Azoarcus sp.]|jgi:hypothetical protein|nr:FixH family protein [Azoarcus sp.]